jgi:6-phosphogluconolactonase
VQFRLIESYAHGMPVVVCEAKELSNLAANRIAAALNASMLTNDGRASLALAGGTTPKAAYVGLSRISGIDWGQVRVFFGDERAVPPDHSDSNYRMAEEALFSRVPLRPEHIYRMHAELPDRDAAARAYEALLPEAIDVMVLGIGEDGHTASLFPGSPALSERTRRVLPVLGTKPPPWRLTLTPPMITSTRSCIVLASGAGKAEAVARALEGALDVMACPAQLARAGLWILDPEAAKQLRNQG